MKLSKTIYTEVFEQYKKMGLDPVPIPYENGNPKKFPTEPGWQVKAANGRYTKEDFTETCNIGILLGGEENVTDIDCDSPEAVAVSIEIMEDLMNQTGKTMMFGRESKPRSHYIFLCDQSLRLERIKDPIDQECIVEYRCVNKNGERGQQTVFPPSLRYDDQTGETEEIRLEQDSAPEPIRVEAKRLHETFRTIAATSLLAKHFPIKGERRNTILALAGMFTRNAMPEDKAVQIITLAYLNSKGYNCDIDRAESDARGVYKEYASNPEAHLFGYPKLRQILPKAVVDKVLELLDIERPDQQGHHLTDAGNGRRLVDKYESDIRYCVDERCWYVWNGVRWWKDSVNNIRELAKEIANDIRNEANSMKPPKSTGDEGRDKEALVQYQSRKKEILRWANQTENADKVSKTIISAESDPKVTCHRSDFDKQSSLLNCENCVVNLYTGEIIPHDRNFMMSNLCPVNYDPSATHDVWDQSIAAFTRNHPDLSPFLKRVAGYSIQGDKSEERILILYGPGSAGKGTFMDWLTSALGPDYACAMDANSVLKQKRDSAAASGDIARLQGKRIVVVSEIEKGSRVQESFMKQASGNDSIVARGLYKSESEFRPTHQFWFQSNYRPGFDSTDSGNKRRYLELPFDNDLSTDPLVTFDPKLKIRMRQDPEFLKAVLAWCVEGCIEWYKDGLLVPESVTAATKGLFAHNDFLSEFLDDMCVKDPEEKVSVRGLWDAYFSWCREQGEEPAQGRTFNRMMEERGYERKGARIDKVSMKSWVGIRLKEQAMDAQEIYAAAVADIERSPRQKRIDTVFNGGVKVA
jgi:P4 family phage/plasmid primase-like protien